MDSLAPMTNYGDSSHKKLKKSKRKKEDTIVCAQNQFQSEAEERGKDRKVKSKDRSEEDDISMPIVDAQPEKKKRKQSKGSEEIHTTELLMSRKESNMHDSSSLKKKKKLVEKNKRLDKINQELMAHDCNDCMQNKDKHLDNNVGIGDDSSHKVVGTLEENQVYNSSDQTLCKAAGKMKQNKSRKLGSHAEINKTEECTGGSLLEDSASKKKRNKSKPLIAPLDEENSYSNVKVKTKPDDESSSQKKTKTRNGLAFADPDCSSAKMEKLVIDDLSPKKKKRKHRSSFCVQDEDTGLNMKEIPQQGNFSLESNKKLGLEGVSSREGTDTDEIILDGCLKKQRKERELREKFSCSESCEAKRNDDNSPVYQENIVDELWMEIRSKIDSQIQHNREEKKTKHASEQRDTVQAENKSDEGEGVWQSMDFTFDNHPFVRHYIPKKLISLNGLSLRLNEMTKVNLKVPRTYFRGSSLDSIPGYGYNT